MSTQASSAETTITITHSQTNRIAGFGILLPPRSIAPSTLTIIPFEGSAGEAGAGACSLIGCRLVPAGR